jgi:hypothetical protein
LLALPSPLFPPARSIIQKGPKLSEKVDNAKNAWISTCFGENPFMFESHLFSLQGGCSLTCTSLLNAWLSTCFVESFCLVA